MGGMSTNHGLEPGGSLFRVRSMLSGVVLERVGNGRGFRVYGTLLGPETTGPIDRYVPALRCRW